MTDDVLLAETAFEAAVDGVTVETWLQLDARGLVRTVHVDAGEQSLTPDAARRLAAVLVRAAEIAER